MPESRGTENRDAGQTKADEVRCSKCGYFVCQRLFAGVGEIGLKFVCKRCKARLLVKISAATVTVGQV